MSTVPHKKFYSPEEYLALEKVAPQKSEYYCGEIFSMAGGSPQHNQISIAIAGLLFTQLEGTPCEPLPSDQRIGIPAVGLYTYPDVSVVCGGLEFDQKDDDAVVNPRVIIEVLSPSTENYDRVKKFGFYRNLESFAEYLLVAQDRPCIERYVKRDDGSWVWTIAEGLDASMPIDTIQCQLSLARVYHRVTFEPPSTPQNV